MKLKNKIIAGTIAALTVAALTGCTTPTIVNNARSWEQKLPDGRTVTCVYGGTNDGGGISCDWENAR